ncbi:MAG: hypothetical protein WB383_03885 [Acidimicrobiales bacterium]
MDVLTLPAPSSAPQVSTAPEADSEQIVLRVRRVFPLHAGCSGQGVLTIEALNAHGTPVTAYLHVPDDQVADLASYNASWGVASR